MVDFNNDTTITGRSAEDILRVIIMERRYNLFDAVENYVKLDAEGNATERDAALIKARAYALFLEIEETVKRHMEKDKEGYANLLKCLNSNQYNLLLEAVRILMSVLDKVKLTRLDTRRPYDQTRVATEDKEKGHG